MEPPDRGMEGLRKGSLYTFIAFLAISALTAIGVVLFGSFGAFEVKVLMTTSTIAAASICALACSAHSGRSGNPLPGKVGLVLAVLTAALVMYGIWGDPGSELYWKSTAISATFAVAFAHALALLLIGLKREYLWIRPALVSNIFGLAAVIAILVIFEIDSEGYGKLIVILSILAALVTLVVPILGRVSKSDGDETAATLSLSLREDGSYVDSSGQIYDVTPRT